MKPPPGIWGKARAKVDEFDQRRPIEPPPFKHYSNRLTAGDYILIAAVIVACLIIAVGRFYIP